MYSLNGQALSQHILGSVGQCYDGASVMSRNCKGVQSRIRTEAPEKSLKYCCSLHGPKLNLALVDMHTLYILVHNYVGRLYIHNTIMILWYWLVALD